MQIDREEEVLHGSDDYALLLSRLCNYVEKI